MVKEKYLPYVEPPKKPEPPKTPAEIRRLKWDNFWYYHKFHVLVALFIILAIAVTFYYRDTSPEPDYQVGFVTTKMYPDDFLDSLERELSRYADDRNGDGVVTVTVNNYMLNSSSEDPQLVAANMARFMGDAELVSSVVFLTDKTNLIYYTQEGYFGYYKTAELVPENTDFTVDDVGWDWSNSPIATADEMLRLQKEPLYFTIRPNYGSLIDKNREYYDASWAFFQRILNNEVIYSPEGTASSEPSAS